MRAERGANPPRSGIRLIETAFRHARMTRHPLATGGRQLMADRLRRRNIHPGALITKEVIDMNVRITAIASLAGEMRDLTLAIGSVLISAAATPRDSSAYYEDHF